MRKEYAGSHGVCYPLVMCSRYQPPGGAGATGPSSWLGEGNMSGDSPDILQAYLRHVLSNLKE